MSEQPPAFVPRWLEIERPVGPQPIPDWAKGVHINWMPGFYTWPRIKIKTDRELRNWDGQRYERVGSVYTARHPDGRLEEFNHAGALSMQTFRRRHGMVWVDFECLGTTQQEGFGGAHYPITLLDGTELVLRGPWHGPDPDRYQGVAYVDMSRRPLYRRDEPWHRATARAGLWLRQDVLIRILARYVPHLRLAMTYGSESCNGMVEPLKPQWHAPLRWMYEAERTGAAPHTEIYRGARAEVPA